MKIHFVKAGETLFEISKKYGVTIEEIVAANKSIIDPNLIMAGMKLIIPVKQQQVPIPVDSVAPSIHQFPLNLNFPHIPVYPEQALSQSTPQVTLPTMPPIMPPTMSPTMPQIMEPTMPPTMPQIMQPTMPKAPPGNVNQGFTYPGQAVPPFAAIPMPAHQVTAPVSMVPVPAWTTPTGYTAYNTPYHMTNYSMPNSIPYPAFQGMPQVNSNYQPYATSMMQYPNNENYEYYSTYSALQSNAEWPSHNPQPHGQFNQQQQQTTQDIAQPQLNNQMDDNEERTTQQEKKKARASSTSKESVSVKAKSNSLLDQVVRLQQRNKANQR